MRRAVTPEEADEMAIPSYLHPNVVLREMAWWRVAALGGRIRRAARRFGRRDLTIVDFGCGTGVLLETEASVAAKVVGVDLVLAPARMLVEARGLGGKVELMTPDGAAALADASVDLVVAGEVLEHVEPVEPTLALFRRILRPTGRLLVTLPTENALYRLGRKIAGFSGHYHESDAKAVDRVLRRSGFRRVAKKSLPFGGPLSIYWVLEYTPNA
ncbi:MAG TPA: class I SAM-dependent methyltransferase [Minicystis sp.]|nr:class I SAM-dependent methyltransferase [Minicystis sp.]